MTQTRLPIVAAITRFRNSFVLAFSLLLIQILCLSSYTSAISVADALAGQRQRARNSYQSNQAASSSSNSSKSQQQYPTDVSFLQTVEQIENRIRQHGNRPNSQSSTLKMETLDNESDTNGVIDLCPFQGTVNSLKKYGNKLMYEGKQVLARACYSKAMRKFLRPNWEPDRELPPLPAFDESVLFHEVDHDMQTIFKNDELHAQAESTDSKSGDHQQQPSSDKDKSFLQTGHDNNSNNNNNNDNQAHSGHPISSFTYGDHLFNTLTETAFLMHEKMLLEYNMDIPEVTKMRRLKFAHPEMSTKLSTAIDILNKLRGTKVNNDASQSSNVGKNHNIPNIRDVFASVDKRMHEYTEKTHLAQRSRESVKAAEEELKEWMKRG
jgi:hypothetical protein